MKKYMKFFVAFALVISIVGIASSSSVWAEKFSGSDETKADSPFIIRQKPNASSITITESGKYRIGGICEIDVTYNQTGLKNTVDIDIPTDFSTDIPFGYEGDLYLPGCHIIHYKNDEIVRKASPENGEWQVCFAERPEVELTIYYYLDDPATNSQVWIELETTHEDGLACANAPYTGEYAPGSKVDAVLEISPRTDIPQTTQGEGTVVPPPASITISGSGIYSVGGICTFYVLYTDLFQSDQIHVADALRHDHDPIDDYNYEEHDEFPDEGGLLYQPGCHILHYDAGLITHWEKFVDQGDWKICFAAYPDKEMTIYAYLGDLSNQESSWIPLETTTENGEACAPAFYTGVYVPTGK